MTARREEEQRERRRISSCSRGSTLAKLMPVGWRLRMPPKRGTGAGEGGGEGGVVACAIDVL